MKIFKVTGLEFKTPELEQEWLRSGHIDPRIRAINMYLAFYCFIEFKKNWLITHIGRSDQQQIKLYPEFFRVYSEIKPSKHLVRPVQAIDSRSHHLELEEIQELEKATKKWFGDITEDFLYKYHKGDALHVHTQV